MIGVDTPDREFLTQLRMVVPFLKKIPDEIYFILDISEFYVPTGKVAQVRSKLEKTLNSFVMTYKKDVLNLLIPVERHLCANIKTATLSANQIVLLEKQERELAELNVNFVVYEKPLILINPLESPIAHYYKDSFSGSPLTLSQFLTSK